MKFIKVLVADDHELIRRGIRSLLASTKGIQVIGEAIDGDDAKGQVRLLVPDVLILDLRMPGADPFRTIETVRKVQPTTEIIVLDEAATVEIVRRVLKAGAKGYVLKTDSGRDLLTAIRQVSQHREFFTDRVSEVIVEGFVKAGNPSNPRYQPERRLTERESEVARLAASGLGNKAIAAALGLSVNTVETHRNRIARILALPRQNGAMHAK